MNSFTLQLQDATHADSIAGVISFVGEDDSGSFGILAGHAHFITTLEMGLARFRTADAGWRYLAVPGAVLHFRDGVLTLSTRRYLLDDDYDRISRTYFPRSYFCPEGMSFANSEALFPGQQLSATIRTAYEGQCRLLCYRPHPSWDEVQARFTSLRDLL